MSAFYYCTHSLGPLIHISGQRPVSVTGFEAPFNDRMWRMGAKAGPFAVEMVTLESGALLKSLHGVGPSKSSLWYSVYGKPCTDPVFSEKFKYFLIYKSTVCNRISSYFSVQNISLQGFE